MRSVFEASTVEEFWAQWSFVPRPRYLVVIILFNFFLCSCFMDLSFCLSEVFLNGSTKTHLQGRTLDGFSMFKKGIIPQWEDPANSLGAELQYRKTMNPQEIDTHWENMVLALIGEVIDENNEICGCRVVDKAKKNTRSIFRLELWLRTQDPEAHERIKSRLIEAFCDSDPSKSRIKPTDFTYISSRKIH